MTCVFLSSLLIIYRKKRKKTRRQYLFIITSSPYIVHCIQPFPLRSNFIVHLTMAEIQLQFAFVVKGRFVILDNVCVTKPLNDGDWRSMINNSLPMDDFLSSNYFRFVFAFSKWYLFEIIYFYLSIWRYTCLTFSKYFIFLYRFQFF